MYIHHCDKRLAFLVTFYRSSFEDLLIQTDMYVPGTMVLISRKRNIFIKPLCFEIGLKHICYE